MKQSEMDKLQKFVKHALADGWRYVPMGLAQLLDTFEIDPPSAKEKKENLGWTGQGHEPSEAFGVVSPPMSQCNEEEE